MLREGIIQSQVERGPGADKRRLQALQQACSIVLNYRMQDLNLHQVPYKTWLISGIANNLEGSSMAVALFSLGDGWFNLEYADFLLPHYPRAYYLKEIARLQMTPALAEKERRLYGSLVKTRGEELRRLEKGVFPSASLPSSMIIFGEPIDIAEVYLVCPAEIPPSVALGSLKKEISYRIRQD